MHPLNSQNTTNGRKVLNGYDPESNALNKRVEELFHTISELFNCSVTMDKFAFPVITQCGHTFDETAIREALQYKTSCPLCRKEISRVQPNKEIIKLKQVWMFYKHYLQRQEPALSDILLSNFKRGGELVPKTLLGKQVVEQFRLLAAVLESEKNEHHKSKSKMSEEEILSNIYSTVTKGKNKAYLPLLAMIKPEAALQRLTGEKPSRYKSGSIYEADAFCEIARAFAKNDVDRALKILEQGVLYFDQHPSHLRDKCLIRIIRIMFSLAPSQNLDRVLEILSKLGPVEDMFTELTLLARGFTTARPELAVGMASMMQKVIVDAVRGSEFSQYKLRCIIGGANMLSELAIHFSQFDRDCAIDLANQSFKLIEEVHSTREYKRRFILEESKETVLINLARAFASVGRTESAFSVTKMIERVLDRVEALISIVEGTNNPIDRARLLPTVVFHLLRVERIYYCPVLSSLVAKRLAFLVRPERILTFARLTEDPFAQCEVAKALFPYDRKKAIEILDKQIQYVLENPEKLVYGYEIKTKIIKTFIPIDLERAQLLAIQFNNSRGLTEVGKVLACSDPARAFAIANMIKSRDQRCEVFYEILKFRGL